MNDIKELLNTLVNVPVQVVRATVQSVDTDNWTAKVVTVEGGGERFQVRLRVIADGSDKGIIVQPKNDSEVLIGIVENNRSVCYLVQCSEIVLVRIEIGDKLLIEIPEDGKVKVKAQEVHFDGSKSGLIDLKGLLDRLNAIEKDINALKTIFSGWGVTPNDGGGALKTAAASWYADLLDTTSETNIKTQKITW